MPTIKPPRGIPFNLALRLYLLLVAIIVPALMVYYVYNVRALENLHEQEVDQSVRLVSSRLDDWLVAYETLADLRSEDRDALHRELEKIVVEPNGVETVSFFFVSGGSLDFTAAFGPAASSHFTPEDARAVLERAPVKRGSLSVSVPIIETGEVRGLARLSLRSGQGADPAAQAVSSRLGEWLRGVRSVKRETLNRGLKRVIEEPGGIESISVFLMIGGNLTNVASHGPYAPTRPQDQDERAVRERRIEKSDLLLRGDTRSSVVSVSAPLLKKDGVRGLLHMQIVPEKLGLGQWLPRLRASLVYGAIALTVIVGVGVGFFFHFSVRRPIRDLMEAMAQVAGGNLGANVESRSGEFGWLAASYNHMTRRLKSSVDENRRLLEQIKGFNEELKRKIDAATKELAAKNEQLQVVNEKLFAVQRQIATLEKLATLGQVATIIAHELGTPLNAISGHLHMLLQDPPPDPQVLDRLKVIDSQVDRLTGIVRDVLKSMRVPPPLLAQVSVAQVIRGAADLVAPVADKRRIVIDIAVDRDTPAVYADGGQLEQVLMNLFTNAMDAMPGGGKLSVESASMSPADLSRLSKERSLSLDGASYVRIGVADTGTGMDEEAARHAFEPFYTTKQLDGEKGSSSGLGLGLAICRQIVKSHQGEITVTSEKGKGTRFDIYLPVERRHSLGS